MKRWASHLFIASYLGALLFGVAAHSLTYLKSAHPAMYFIVWDMFCGWSAYENRMHLVAEGQSGHYYLLSPAPWGAFVPYGSAERQHYDVSANHGYRLAANTLAHTEHEPIRRILQVEEAWPKKHNLPDPLWSRKYLSDKPDVTPSYFQLRCTFQNDGVCVSRRNNWLTTQYELCVLDNPRLKSDMRKGHQFYATNPGDRVSSVIQQTGFEPR